MLAHVFALFIVTLTFTCKVLSFNINTERVFRQFTGGPDSYFGFSLAFLNEDWLLVGAPRDNDPYLPGIVEPGRLLKCRVTNTGICEAISIDNSTGSDRAGTVYFIQGRDKAWLGATIDVPSVDPNKGIVVCAPRWYNRQYTSEFFMNGLCWAVPTDLNTGNIEKFPMLVRGAKQIGQSGPQTGFLDYGMGSMGFSLHYTTSNKDLLFGAPGLVDFTGGFLRKKSDQTFVIMESAYEDYLKTHDRYIGYAATSGRYFLDIREYYVFGAPRADLVGKVYFFQGGMDSYTFKNASLELTPRDMENKDLPMNSYFGASLCTVDVNADGYDELLVGAPLYGNVSSRDEEGGGDLIDVGRVYLYLGKTEKGEFGRNVHVLRGDNKMGARFGSSITSLGDINKDGYNDVAVGAPFEDDLRGSVYVYNGYRDGLWPMYSQKILARQLDSGLRAFGHAISKPMDVNSDEINDVAIGAFLSDHVTVLLGQPPINMEASVMVTEDSITDLNVIDQNSNTTYVQVCFRYVYRQCTRVTLNVTITLDTEKGDLSRVFFKGNHRQVHKVEMDIFSGDRPCLTPDQAAIYSKPTFDFVSPIVILVEYDMISNTCPASNPTISKFNGNKPGDPLLALRKTMHFKNDCPNNNCSTDLHLVTMATYENVDGYFVVGTPSLVLNINITKSGDPSYGSLFRMTLPNTLRYRNVVETSDTGGVVCSLENSLDEQQSSIEVYKNESLLECSVGNPMSDNTGVQFKLNLQVPYSISDTTLEFRMVVDTLSYEQNEKDNNKRLEIKLKNHVEALLYGVANPDTVLIQDQTGSYDITHIYELKNRGPSLLPSAYVDIAYPQIQSKQMASLYLNRTKVRCGKPCEVECTIKEPFNGPPVWVEVNGRSFYIKRPTNDSELPPLRYLNCREGSCSTHSCRIRDLAPEQSVSINLDFVVLKQVEGIIQSQKTLEMITMATAHLDSPNLIAERTRFQNQLKTLLLPRVPPKTGVAWWIILVSILGGLILIALLIFVLYKIGFFKRKRIPQAPPRTENNVPDDKEKLADDKESISLTDSEHDVIDKNGKGDKF